jgi:hypothetical protein
MKIVRSIAGLPIRLTAERLDHIARRHPEMVNQEEKILETLTSPDCVQEGDEWHLDCGKVLSKDAGISEVLYCGV